MLLGIYALVVLLFEKIGVGGGGDKGPIIFAILPTILISVIMMFVSNRFLTKNDA